MELELVADYIRVPTTRVKARFSASVGVPKCSVRVVSVVPSMYWAPESQR